MKFEYNKVTKTIEITGIEGLEQVLLLVNDMETSIEEGSLYTFMKDEVYKISISHLVTVESEVEGEITTSYTREIVELGHLLVIEYSRAKNRSLLISVLDEEKYDGFPSIYSKNRRLIT